MDQTEPRVREMVSVLEEGGYRPVEVAPDRWLALCPCCDRLSLVVQAKSAEMTAPTQAERDIWLDHWEGR